MTLPTPNQDPWVAGHGPGPKAQGDGPYGYVSGRSDWSGYGYVPGGAAAGQGAVPSADERPFPLGFEPYGEKMSMPGADSLAPIPLSRERLVLRPNLVTSGGLGFWATAWLSIGCLYTGVGLIINEPDQIGYILLALVVGVATLALVVFTALSRTVLDAAGVHLYAYGRSRDLPWPTSRSNLFARLSAGKVVKGAEVVMVVQDGEAVPLIGLSWAGVRAPSVEAKAVAQCSRIWDWAVARGYTEETHEYIPLSGVTWKVQQALRENQEHRFGLR